MPVGRKAPFPAFPSYLWGRLRSLYSSGGGSLCPMPACLHSLFSPPDWPSPCPRGSISTWGKGKSIPCVCIYSACLPCYFPPCSLLFCYALCLGTGRRTSNLCIILWKEGFDHSCLMCVCGVWRVQAACPLPPTTCTILQPVILHTTGGGKPHYVLCEALRKGEGGSIEGRRGEEREEGEGNLTLVEASIPSLLRGGRKER